MRYSIKATLFPSNKIVRIHFHAKYLEFNCPKLLFSLNLKDIQNEVDSDLPGIPYHTLC